MEEAMMAKRLSGTARRELIAAVSVRYLVSSPPAKREILREFAAITGYHRKSAIRILNGHVEDGMAVVQRGRLRIYDEAFCATLIVLWEASDRVCGKRLQALLPSLVPALERHGHLVLDPSARGKLLGVSAATIDRLLAEARGLCDRRRVRRAPTALRRSVPIRTYADWNSPEPGFMEIDLVAHCGDRLVGAFVYTLTLTDISSTWTECVPLLVRTGALVVETIDYEVHCRFGSVGSARSL
jgi:GNAT superfamily N-acetyltransferase